MLGFPWHHHLLTLANRNRHRQGSRVLEFQRQGETLAGAQGLLQTDQHDMQATGSKRGGRLGGEVDRFDFSHPHHGFFENGGVQFDLAGHIVAHRGADQAIRRAGVDEVQINGAGHGGRRRLGRPGVIDVDRGVFRRERGCAQGQQHEK